MKYLLASFKKSLKRLDEILEEKKTITNRDASIQRFEFTIELAWKCLQKYLREQQIVCQSPKACFKEAFTLGLIDDDKRWIEMMEDRNLTVHTYDEALADDVYDRLESYVGPLKALQKTLEEKMGQ